MDHQGPSDVHRADVHSHDNELEQLFNVLNNLRENNLANDFGDDYEIQQYINEISEIFDDGLNQQGGAHQALVEISRARSRLNRFRLDTHCIQYRIAPLPAGENPIEWTKSAFRAVYDEIVHAGGAGNNRFCLTFGFDGMTRGDAWEKPRAINGYEFEDLWRLVNSISQSAGGFNVVDTFTITLHVAEATVGQGCDFDSIARPKNGVIGINNPKKDYSCLPRALAVAAVWTNKQFAQADSGELLREWNDIRNSSGKKQRVVANALTEAAGVKIPETGCGYDEIVKFQDYFADRGTAIIVYSLNPNSGKDHPVFYDGSGVVRMRLGLNIPHRTLRILLYPDKKHFDVISNLRTFQGYNNYCEPCRIGSSRPTTHKCEARCARCLQSPACRTEFNMIQCNDCNREFYGRICFENHLKPGSYRYGRETVCKNLRYCIKCNYTYYDQQYDYSKHKCGIRKCNICKVERPHIHDCYMPTVKPLKETKEKCNAFVYYDLETRQEDTMPGTERSYLHVPNLCISQIVCEKCCNEDDSDISTNTNACCGQREFIFYGEKCVEEFVDYIDKICTIYSKVICIAHNAKGFDGQFILREVVKKKVSGLNTIMAGTSITLLEYNNIKFIDSINYLAMPLAKIPKSFGLPEIAKGYFPHHFNTAANQNYVGSMPPMDFYSPKTLCKNKKQYDEFKKWYEDCVQEGYIFDFKKELIFYCQLDVTILRRGCNKFRNLILNTGNVCPFAECVTIASTCMRINQRNFLKADTIGIIPRNGYRLTNTQSRVALEWLLWLAHKDQIEITSALNGKEFNASPTLRLDGYREENDKRYAYQFHGCYWHGCPDCYKCHRHDPLGTTQVDTFEERFQKTLANGREIRKLGYELIEQWECKFISEKKKNTEMSAFLAQSKTLSILPLDPRAAFYGGRTGNAVTHCDVDGLNKKIKYVDVCSLYPWVSKYGTFPIGHPKLYIGEDCDKICPNNNITSVLGLIKCTVLPPRTLLHPVLPVRGHGKLLFPLCRTCTLEKSQKDCRHENEKDRELCGTWVSCELQKAVEIGYVIKEIHEIWHYENYEKYDKETHQGGLFTKYINTFLKIKQETSGWPSWCVDENSKKKYIAEYLRVEGIQLEKNKIGDNPGLRAVAKLCLNSFWGKFGQRENMLKHSIVNTHEEFVHLVFNPEIEVTSLVPVNDETVFISWKMLDECYEISNKANVVIAAFTTAQARLKLYGYLSALGESVLYYDTDSVIYVSDGTNDLPTGDFLGDLTDEILNDKDFGKDCYISSFVSGGPKCYAFVVQKPDGNTGEICKFKGVRQNYNTSGDINFNSLRALVLGEQEGFEIEYDGIRRTKYHQVITRKEKKKVQVTGPKRRIIDEDGNTRPYGYKQSRLA